MLGCVRLSECAHVRDDVPLEDVFVGKVCRCNIFAGGTGKKPLLLAMIQYWTPEMEIFFMLFGRCHTKNQKRSLKRHIKHFNFRSKIQLDHPVQRPSPPRRPRSPFTMTLSAATTSTTTLRTMMMTDHSMSGKRETVRGVASHPRRLLWRLPEVS